MRFDAEKHRRHSIRLPHYDYSSVGAYFVTLCTRERECLFGEIQKDVGAGLAPAQIPNDVFQLTTVGKIVEKNWLQISQRYQYVEVDEYIIMPNHLHGIVMIGFKDKRATARVAPTLGQIIGSFKSTCVTDYLKHIRENQLEETGKIWQRNYGRYRVKSFFLRVRRGSHLKF
ncbi:MAG: transposase [Pseudomonadota bacterium]